jgi:microcin C transport system permease protein
LPQCGGTKHSKKALQSKLMFAYISKRFLLFIPTLFGVLVLNFAVMQFVPGGPVEQILAEMKVKGEPGAADSSRGLKALDQKQIEELKKLYGFDKPAPERFMQMMRQYIQFDLGKSFFQPKDVWQLIKEKLPVSITLGMWTFFLSYAISIPLGIAKAVRAGTKFDLWTTLIVLMGYAIPGFVLGVAL